MYNVHYITCLDLPHDSHNDVLYLPSPPQPLVPGAMLYPGRCSVWQPVPVATNTTCAVPVPVAVPTAMAEVPKESIIANTDFTTTSLIAKRCRVCGGGV